ncbi:MAG: hypothetical protein ABFD92_08700 [Planctomycetaceae bacterium]|nr:hypothetical protein [Planctomycetaceae bacterium]
MAEHSTNPGAHTNPSDAPRRRRWPWIVAAVAVLLAALVFAAPYLISTRAGTDLVLRAVNDRIDQSVAADDVSLTWLGPCQASDVRVVDEQGRDVALVKNVQLQKGLLGLIFSPYRFEKATLTEPRVTVYVDQPREEEPSGKLPDLAGQVVVIDGQLMLRRLDGRAIDVQQINADLTLNTLDRINGRFRGSLASGGAVGGTVDLDNVQEGFEKGLDRITGNFQVATDQGVNLAPLVHFADASLPFQGTASLRASAVMEQRKINATVLAEGKALTSARPQHGPARPMDVRIEGKATSENGLAHGNLALTSGAGTFQAQLAYPLNAPLPQLSGGDILSAIWGGRQLNLPELTLKAAGTFDVAALARSVPALLNIQGGAKITGGSLALNDLSVKGGADATIAMRAALTDFAARAEGKTITLQPVTLNLDAGLQGEKGLQIRQGKLDSDFLKAAATGAATDMNLTYRLDIGQLRSQLGQVFDLGALPQQGLAEGTAVMTKAGDDRVNLEVNLAARDFRRSGAPDVLVEQATVQQSGHILVQQRRPVELIVERGQFAIGQDLAASDSGRYDFRTGAMHFDVNVAQSRLQALATLAQALAGVDLPQVHGTLATKARITRDATGVLDVTLADGSLQGVKAFEQGQPAPPAGIDASFSGQMKLADNRTIATIKTTGAAVALDVELDYPTRSKWRVSARELLAALLEGRPSTMPELRLDVKGRVDGTALAKAAPALAAMPGQTVLRGGTMQLDTFALRGGALPSLKADAKFASVSLTHQGRPIEIKKGTVDVDMNIERGVGLQIGKGLIDSDAGRASLSGSARKLDAVFAINAAHVPVTLAGASGTALQLTGGTLSGTATVARDGQVVDLALAAEATDLAWQEDGKSKSLAKASIEQTSRLEMKDYDPRKITLSRAVVRIPDELVVQGQGWYEFRTGAMDAAVDLQQAKIQTLASWANSLGMDPGALNRYSGQFAGSAKLSAPARGPIVSSGTMNIAGLAVDNRPVGKGPISLDWNGLEYARAARRLAVASATLQSSFASAKATDLNASLGRPFTLQGAADASADLAPVMDVVRPLAASARKEGGQPAPPLQLSGRANWKGQFQTVGQTISIEGRGGVSNFVAGQAQPVNIDFDQIIAIDRQSDSMNIRALKINSQPDVFTMTASGTVGNYTTDMNADITGRYTGSWPYIMELLKQFAPEVERELAVTGQTRGDFFIRGPINKPGAQPGWRDLSAQTTVSWRSIKLRNFGVTMEEASMTPSLSGGRVGVPTTPVPAMDGQVVLGGTVMAAGPANNYALQGRHQVLKSLKISAELGKDLLGRFNPVFAEAVGIEGRVSLAMEDFYWPLDKAQIRQARGRGALNLADLKLRVGGPLGKLLGPLNSALMPALTDSVNFEIRDGRIHYDNFKLVYARIYDVRFSGSVAFVDDEQVDLVMSLPITPDVLQQFKVAGPINDISRVLGEQRVEIPLKGTRLHVIPRLEAVNIQPMIAKAMEQLIKEGILKGGLIPKLPEASPRKPGDFLPDLPIPGLDKSKNK